MTSDASPVLPKNRADSQTELARLLLRFKKRREAPSGGEESLTEHDRWCLQKINAVRVRSQKAEENMDAVRNNLLPLRMQISENLFCGIRYLLRCLFKRHHDPEISRLQINPAP